jgi:hypothetical protein
MISISKCCRKWRGCFVLSALLTLPFLGESCKSKNAENNQSTEESVIDTLPADFVTFYDRFHEDSAFQMDHINFPLEGLPNSAGDGDTLATTRFFWQKADWKKHNHFTDPGGDFEQWFEVSDDRIIEHWVHMKGTNLHMRRRFAKLQDGWYLIYYQGMRPVDRESNE